MEYRLCDESRTPLDALDDVRAAFRWVREHADSLRIDPERVAGYGVSAGGHLVAAAATVPVPEADRLKTRSAPDLLLLWSPALDVAQDGWFQRLLQGRAAAADCSPASLAGKGTPPTCVVHGAEDTLTPLAGVARYRDAVLAAGGVCELHVYEGVGHLLTRNLGNQESDYDPDPEKRADGRRRLAEFIGTQGYAR